MSLKDLFNKKDSAKFLPSTSPAKIAEEIESVEYIESHRVEKEKFIPYVDYSDPQNFARYGLAEEYYINSYKRIAKTYPFDGSLKEKLNWQSGSLLIDRYIFDKKYPRSTGYAIFGQHWSANIDRVTASYEDSDPSYGASTTASYEYIKIKGGPHTSGKSIQNRRHS